MQGGRKAHNAMPFIPTPQCAQVEMRFTLDGQQVEWVFHNRVAADEISGEDMAAIAAIYANWWSSSIRLYLAVPLGLREVYVTDQTAQDGGVYSLVPEGAPIPGAAGANASPNNVALVITKRTARRGRSYRGRTYLCAIPEGDTTLSHVSSDYLANINASAALLLANLQAEGYPMCVRSLALNGVPRTTGVLVTVESYSVRDDVIDSQRRRLPGRGA